MYNFYISFICVYIYIYSAVFDLEFLAGLKGTRKWFQQAVKYHTAPAQCTASVNVMIFTIGQRSAKDKSLIVL